MKTKYYDPKTTKFPYADITDKHYLIVKKNRGVAFDKDYTYVDTSKWFLFKQKIIRSLLIFIVFPLMKIRLGLKIEGKENLIRNKELLKNGAISVSNHIHMWDYIAIMYALRKHKTYTIVWDKNMNGENGPLIKLVGGIPFPEDNFTGGIVFIKAVEKLLLKSGWVHIYAEGSMWEYYTPIRPFKTGAAFFAYKTDRPILPMAFSYRKPNFIRRLFGQIATLTLKIGSPMFINKNLSLKEKQIDLTKRVHEEVCRLAGINPDENIYNDVFNQDKRVDYYTTQYGSKYKGSK